MFVSSPAERQAKGEARAPARFRFQPHGSAEMIDDAGPLLRSASETVLSRLLGDPPRKFRTTVITNASADRNDVVEQVTEAGATTQQTRELPFSFPPGIFSLSHVALPFPLTDGLYGLTPDKSENFGVNLGALAPRGERGVLIVNLDSLLRVSSNPFFPYLMDRIAEVMVEGPKPGRH